MKTLPLFCVVAAAAAFAGPADAIFKCTTSKGVVYQDRPCREGSETDVQIVVPTGQIAPRGQAAADEGTLANGARADNRANAPGASRTARDDRASIAKPADPKTAGAGVSGTDNARKTDSRTNAESNVAPLTAEQARKSDPTAKYFATDAFGPGGETPAQMNCESPTGEKRTFYLSNGKLTSI